MEGTTDEDRYLTKIGLLPASHKILNNNKILTGKTQAQYTGKRLKDLGLPITTLVKSTMTRAQETGSIINKSLPEVCVSVAR